MSISHRVSIAWAPTYTPSENTTTLVLTGKTHFVDLRTFLPSHFPPSSSTNVDWAFAGTRSSSACPDGTTRGEWNHHVDSRTLENVTDCGFMVSPHPDHPDDPQLTLETGEMVNPATGVVTAHKEIWRDEVTPVGTVVRFWELKEGKGMVGRIGEKAIGVGRRNGRLWCWKAVEGVAGKWDVQFAEGDKVGLELLESDPKEGGQTVITEGLEWVVKESWVTL